MPLCVICGIATSTASPDVCPHHIPHVDWDSWAESNKIWNDYFHRGVPIKRVDTFKDEEPTYSEC